ncbi:sigma-70 family RNA polymerase sigma factor [Rhodococcus triatomae]|uniref:RNA polymerase sigma-70 factor, ECF subfamily n=1 Tax=Rhodococcus triatomae TaxID=300028 RepID=A0A1G8NRW7_9NOCA|nr:sigma-70 family RNA polymerase sigma factor [Rhodococcus triatomae]QNG20068.1 sigma-70 family RNA polymerase sigma factor [Rhodococcus triatomae]QNG24016.1 sigma-70 family RNA polymerase sigma factor [Rhodococcus triatomae]SDI82726.1 RNA polymerase sigma-70 factor, ECF subfamily [Rhodococcus triatomae]
MTSSEPSEAASDRDLVDAARLGDRGAFEDLVRLNGPLLYRYARRMVTDEGVAAEVVQDTFVAAWRQLTDFRGESSFRTWVFSICSRKITDSRRVKRAQPIDDQLLVPLLPTERDADPMVVVQNSAFLEALELALAELPPRQRACWVLREVEQMTFPQIGEILSMSPDSARGHHHRARTTLGQRLMRWR